MSQTTIEQLNEQLAATNAVLEEALASGGDTTAPRYQIGLIEAEIAASVRRQREEQAEAERVQHAAIDESAAELAAKTHAAVDAAVVVPGLVELSGDPLPAIPQDPAIEAAAREVARCRAALSAAETALKPVADQVERLTGRLNEKRASLGAIKARRLGGEEKPSDAAEMAMLQADIDALQLLVDDARLKAQSADRRQQARTALAQAEAHLEMCRKRLAFDAARTRLVEAERVYLSAWNIMAETGRAIGKHSPWSECPASNEMRRAVTGSVVGMHGL